MFDTLSDRLTGIFDRLTRRGALSDSDVKEALREVRIALLEADVALAVVKDFVDQVQEKASGQDVVKSVTPGQMVIKIVYDHLVEMLGSAAVDINLNAQPPVPMMMVGLQGSGKTTSTAKIGKMLVEKRNSKVLMASLDVRRPAAQEQLRVLGDQILVPTLDIVAGEAPVAIAKRAMHKARLEGYDVVLLDTAGRLAIDDEMMDEAVAIRDAVKAVEIMLVADAMTGQDAVTTASAFHERLGLTGVMLTRVDGDARGGAALSIRTVTGCPIKLLGTGEKLDELEPFHPDRIAGRILGMGDVVSLVEKAAETIEQDEAEALAARMQKGQFDLEDMLKQLAQLKKMGGLGGVMSHLPGIGKIKKQMDSAQIDEGVITRQEAIIYSMTVAERRKPVMIKASRKKRIATGSGTNVQEVNKLLKQHQQMHSVMKRMKKMGKRGGMAAMLSGMGAGGMGGGMPPGMMPRR